tara:strand:- start:168 stop:644 length:477 start_codon:yes stop_codon:yes gene_type:complete
LKTIIRLKSKNLGILYNFLIEEKNTFSEFLNIGWSHENIKNHFEKENNFSIGYLYQNKLSGVLIGEIIPTNECYELEVYIILVSKGLKRKKIGTNLIRYIESNRQLLDISKIYLEVAENNLSAIKFYEKNNFVFSKFRHNYYKYNNKNINAMCYFKEF